MRQERPPRLRLIRVFLSLLVGSMGGSAGWILAVLFLQGTMALTPLLHAVAFVVPGAAASYWCFAMLGSPR